METEVTRNNGEREHPPSYTRVTKVTKKYCAKYAMQQR